MMVKQKMKAKAAEVEQPVPPPTHSLGSHPEGHPNPHLVNMGMGPQHGTSKSSVLIQPKNFNLSTYSGKGVGGNFSLPTD